MTVCFQGDVILPGSVLPDGVCALRRGEDNVCRNESTFVLCIRPRRLHRPRVR